jgi:phage gpG-like protein
MGFKSYFPQVQQTLTSGIQRNVVDATNLARNELIKRQLRYGARSGAVYRKPNQKATYQASAPGEPPANRTGRLSGSWQTDFMPGAGRVGTNVKYLIFLDKGTANMAKRPLMGWVFSAKLPAIRQILGRGIGK